MKGGRTLLDTSAVIAGPGGLELSGETAISVVTIGELRAGVELAGTPQARANRQARLQSVRSAYDPIDVDEAIADRYGEILALTRRERRVTTATDLLIVATAAVTGRALLSFDRSQRRLAELLGVPVVQAGSG